MEESVVVDTTKRSKQNKTAKSRGERVRRGAEVDPDRVLIKTSSCMLADRTMLRQSKLSEPITLLGKSMAI